MSIPYLTVDELDILGALRIAVTGTELRTSLVGRELRETTILSHLDEVKSTVKTAGKVGHVDVEGELLVQELEHLVVGSVLHQVDTGADVGAGDELEGERIAASGDTVGASVVSTVNSAVLSASGGIRADAGIPSVAGVAVGVARGGVEPAPVSVEHDSSVQGRAAGSGTLLRGELRVVLSCLGTGLLCVSNSEVCEGSECESWEHDDLNMVQNMQ